MVLTMLLVRSPSPTHAQFVLASHSWSYPDEYGQGIEYVYFINGIDEVPYNWSYQYFNGTESASLEIRAGSEISLRVHVWLNGTKTGYSYADGRDLGTNVSIRIYQGGLLIFTQALDQAGGSLDNDPMWQYDFTIFLNGDPLYLGPAFDGGAIYKVVFDYEILW